MCFRSLYMVDRQLSSHTYLWRRPRNPVHRSGRGHLKVYLWSTSRGARLAPPLRRLVVHPVELHLVPLLRLRGSEVSVTRNARHLVPFLLRPRKIIVGGPSALGLGRNGTKAAATLTDGFSGCSFWRVPGGGSHTMGRIVGLMTAFPQQGHLSARGCGTGHLRGPLDPGWDALHPLPIRGLQPTLDFRPAGRSAVPTSAISGLIRKILYLF